MNLCDLCSKKVAGDKEMCWCKRNGKIEEVYSVKRCKEFEVIDR